MKKGVLFLVVFAAVLRSGLYARQMSLDEAVKSAARSVEEALPEGTEVAVLNFVSSAERFSDYVIDPVFRWYPAVGIFFMGAGIGYRLIDGVARQEGLLDYYTHGAGVSFEFGWKWDPGKAGGFFMELYPYGSIARGRNPETETTEIAGIYGLFFGMGGAF